MRLRELCKDMGYRLMQGNDNVEVSDIIYDSRKAKPAAAFVCIAGAVTDGHKFIPDAVEKGVSVIVAERPEETVAVPEDVTVIQVESARRALAIMSAAYFGHPAEKLVTIGVTGTKGKTTTTYIIKDVLEHAGKKTGLIGTIAAIIGDETVPSCNTTPESYELHKLMARMVEKGCQYMVMEVSSQGLKLDRTAGINFDYGVFTNLSPDHIGPAEHADFDEYLRCKSMLFRQCGTGIFNVDDKYAGRMMEGHTCSVVTFSASGEKEADLKGHDVEFLNEEGRLGMSFSTSGSMDSRVRINIPGMFSVYNALATMAVCKSIGIADDMILAGLDHVQVAGRVEPVPVSADFSMIIDYAHNEVSTRSVLETLRQYGPSRLIALYGCGGNRSKLRRYDIGEVTGQLADLSILTMDNPRFEQVKDINDDIKVGLAKSGGKYVEIEDRKEAIAYAITHARAGDMIVLLGKGHEDYVEIRGVKHHFSEKEAIWEIVGDIKADRYHMEDDGIRFF